MMIKKVFLSIGLCTLSATALATSAKDQLLEVENEIQKLSKEESYEFVSTDSYNNLPPSVIDKVFSKFGKHDLPSSILDNDNQRTWHPKDFKWKSFKDVIYAINIIPNNKLTYDYAVEINKIDCIASPSLYSTEITYYKNGKEIIPVKKLSHPHIEDKEFDEFVCEIIKSEYLRNEYLKLLIQSKQAMEEDDRMNPSNSIHHVRF